MSFTKIGHKKVRTGCIQCKQRRIKCDEFKPSCQNCQKHHARCSFSVFAYSAKEAHLPILSAITAGSQGRIPGSVDGSSLSLCDLELLHHWTLSTSQSVGSYGQLQRTMQEVVPRLALTQPYLMHAILALSALHLNCLHPNGSGRYFLPALQHYSHALPAFRVSLQSVTNENCHALFASSHLITKCSFAILACTETFLFSNTTEITTDFVSHLRGGFSIHDTAYEWLASGPLGDCLETPLDSDPPFELNPDDDKLARLLPYFNTGSDESDSACRAAVDDLRRLFAMIATPKQTVSTKTLVYCWLARLPYKFIELMNEQTPEALVVLAHYSVMLNMVDEYWFMKGWGIRLLQQCQRNLSGASLDMIEWPLSQLVSVPI